MQKTKRRLIIFRCTCVCMPCTCTLFKRISWIRFYVDLLHTQNCVLYILYFVYAAWAKLFRHYFFSLFLLISSFVVNCFPLRFGIHHFTSSSGEKKHLVFVRFHSEGKQIHILYEHLASFRTHIVALFHSFVHFLTIRYAHWVISIL